MNRSLAAAAVAAVLVASAARLGGPADAGTATGTYGTLTAANASAFEDQCVNEPEQLSLASPADPSNIDVTVTGPGGTSAYGSFDGGGTGKVQLCGSSDPAGTYQVHVALYDDDYNYLSALDTTFKFTLNKPVLKAIVKKVPHPTEQGRGGYQVTGTLTVHRKPWRHQVVRLQLQVKGFWFDFPASSFKKRTNSKGQVVFTTHPKPNHLLLRFDVASTAEAPEVASKPFRLPYYR